MRNNKSVFHVDFESTSEQNGKYFIHGYGYDAEQNRDYEDIFTYFNGHFGSQYLESEDELLSRESISYIRQGILATVQEYQNQQKGNR